MVTNGPRKSRVGMALAAAVVATLGVASLLRLSATWAAFVGLRQPTTVRKHCVALEAAGDPALRARIGGVKKTAKITDAMRLVAAAKVRRAQDGVGKTRPFSNELQGMIKGLVKKLKGSGLEQELPMLRVAEKTTKVGLVGIFSDRGLCGGYNAFNGKRLAARVKQLNDQGISPNLIIVGRQGKKQFQRRAGKMSSNYTDTAGSDFFNMPDTLSAKFSSSLADKLRNLFVSGEVDKVEIVYSKFINLLTSEPVLRTLLPLTPTGIEDPEDETFALTTEDGKLTIKKEKVPAPKATEIESDVIFDQAPESILNSMLPLYLNSQLLTLLWEAQASELGARMNAMKTATDNANDLVKRLVMIFNKQRQAAITQEICEIVSGAMATEGGDEVANQMVELEMTPEFVTEEFMQEIETGSMPNAPSFAE